MSTCRILTQEEAESKLYALLKEDNLVPLMVTGTSMVPFLRHMKDTVYLRGTDFISPGKGDIVLFARRDSSALVLHRIYEIRDDVVIVNGDAQTWFESVEPNRIIGVVEMISRNGKKPFHASKMLWRMLCKIWRAAMPFRAILLKIAHKIKSE